MKQSSAAVRTITSRTRWTWIGELEIIRQNLGSGRLLLQRLSSFAGEPSDFSSDPLTAAAEVERVASLRRFSFTALGLRALAGSPLSLERLFIGSPVGLSRRHPRRSKERTGSGVFLTGGL